MLHFVKLQVFLLILGVGFVSVCFSAQETNRTTGKPALIYVENRLKLLHFNSANVVVNPVRLAPIYELKKLVGTDAFREIMEGSLKTVVGFLISAP